jgi:hypothetical protein
MTTAVLICAGLLLAWLALYSWLTTARKTAPYQPRHSHVPFADPADRTDPDGEQYVAQLRTAGRLPYCWDEDEADAGWWNRGAPQGAVEVLTGPQARIVHTSQLTLNVLQRVRDGLSAPPASDGGDGGPATGEMPALLAAGTITPAQVTAKLAARYLT